MNITTDELKNILEKHALWVRGNEHGVRANLYGADLNGADLNGANLRGANLRGANLRGANLCASDFYEADLNGANLNGANLRGANLYFADLSEADLYGANLYEANLSGAYLSGTILCGADLRFADLGEADLYGADLSRADLRRADLLRADLLRADLRRADLSGANIYGAKNVNIPLACPEKGSFVGFKKARGTKEEPLIVELEIPEDAMRSSATGRKCRCSKAKVVSITTEDGSEVEDRYAYSSYNPEFIYEVGKTVEVSDFDPNRWNECAPGIHFFVTRQEAVDYIV